MLVTLSNLLPVHRIPMPQKTTLLVAAGCIAIGVKSPLTAFCLGALYVGGKAVLSKLAHTHSLRVLNSDERDRVQRTRDNLLALNAMFAGAVPPNRIEITGEDIVLFREVDEMKTAAE